MELPIFLQGVHGTAYKFSGIFVELPTSRVKFQGEVVGGEISLLGLALLDRDPPRRDLESPHRLLEALVGRVDQSPHRLIQNLNCVASSDLIEDDLADLLRSPRAENKIRLMANGKNTKRFNPLVVINLKP